MSNDTPNPSYSLELTYLNIDVEYASCNIHKSKVDANNNVNIRGYRIIYLFIYLPG